MTSPNDSDRAQLKMSTVSRGVVVGFYARSRTQTLDHRLVVRRLIYFICRYRITSFFGSLFLPLLARRSQDSSKSYRGVSFHRNHSLRGPTKAGLGLLLRSPMYVLSYIPDWLGWRGNYQVSIDRSKYGDTYYLPYVSVHAGH